MENKIAIITDSTCDLPEEVVQRYNITIVPLRIVYKTHEFKDRIEITPEKVYKTLEQEVPKSSLPLPDDVLHILDGLKAKGYNQVLYISLSSLLSGTYNMTRLLAQEYSGMDIRVVDSATLSMGLGFLVMEAARIIEQTNNIDKAIMHIKAVRSEMSGMFVLKTLEYLIKGGRIGKVAGVLASALKIKPLIYVNDAGEYVTMAKSRSRSKAIDSMIGVLISKYANRKLNIAVVHGDASEDAQGLLKRLKSIINIGEHYITQVGPVLGVHTGPGLLGIVAYPAN